MRKFNKLILFIICLVLSISLFSCGKDNLIWTNETAVYAYVKDEYKEEVLKDLDKAFKSFDYKKIYIAEVLPEDYKSLKLLFILNDGENEFEFRKRLQKNEKINWTSPCYDLPFETIDTREMVLEKTTIKVGEMVEISWRGVYSKYSQPFNFKGFYAKIKNSPNGKKYKISDFPGLDLERVENVENFEDGWVYLELKTEDYFSLIKAKDRVAKMKKIEFVEEEIEMITSSPYTPPEWPEWEISNPEIVEIINKDGKSWVKGLKPGKAIIKYKRYEKEITVE